MSALTLMLHQAIEECHNTIPKHTPVRDIPHTALGPEPETEPVLEPVPEPVPEPEPVVELDPEPEPESVVDPEPEPEQEAVVEPKPEPEPEPEPAPAPEPEIEPKPEQPEPAPEPVCVDSYEVRTLIYRQSVKLSFELMPKSRFENTRLIHGHGRLCMRKGSATSKRL